MQTEKIIRQIRILFWAILSAMAVMLLIALFIVQNIGPVIEWTITQKENFKSVILILALGGVPASYFFHSKKIKHLNTELPFEEKLKQFKNSFFIKIVTLEALSILGLIGYMLTADNTFLYVFALLFIAYLINRPTRNNIISEIEPEETD
ncbi:hypothetical protein [Marinilabilia sp.]|jgi:uncharacterized membrane protein YqgA involved in biofilm formation